MSAVCPVPRQPAEIASRQKNDKGADITPGTRDRLVRLAFRFLWNHDDAEDAVQEAMISSLQHGAELTSAERRLSWLTSIVVRKCHEFGRKKTTRKRHYLRWSRAIESQTGQQIDTTSNEFTALKKRLALLPRRQREVIVLRHLESMSYEQIGDILNISASTARVHARNGLEAMRKMFGKASTGVTTS